MRRVLDHLVGGLFLSVLLVSSVHASVSPTIPIPQFKQLSTADGLSQDTVNDLLIAPDGYLWVATEFGLHRYDGYRVSLAPAPLNGLPIVRLAVDQQGRLWAGTRYSGIYVFDLSSGEIIKHLKLPFEDNESIMQTMEGFIADRADASLLAVSNRVIRVGTSGEVGEELVSIGDSLVDTHRWIRAIHRLGDVLYIGTTAGCIAYHLKLDVMRSVQLVPESQKNKDNSNVKAFYNSGDRVYIGTVEGLYSTSHQQVIDYLESAASFPTVEVILPQRNIWQIVDSQRGTYLATDHGLYLLSNSNAETLHIFRTSDGRIPISDDDLKTVALDKHGNLWLGTQSDGALYWSADALGFQTISQHTHSQLSHDQVWTIHESDNGLIWIGTQNGLNAYEPDTGEVTSYLVNQDEKQVESASSIYQILPLGEGKLWLTTASEVGLFDTSTGHYSEVTLTGAASMPKYVWGANLDARGRVWFVAEAGIYTYEPDTNKLTLNEKLSAKFNINEVAGILSTESEFPNELMLSVSGALWQLNTETNEVDKVHEVEGEIGPYEYAESVVFDHDNRLWVSYSGHGLYVVDRQTKQVVAHYDAKNSGLESDTLYQLTTDSKGNIWTSSHTGLYRYSFDTETFQQFDVTQGLLTNEFNGGASSKLDDGRIVFGSVKGAVAVTPSAFNVAPEHQGKVKVSDIRLLSGGLDYPLVDLTGEKVVIDHDDVGLVVEFTTVDYKYSDQTRFRYTLSGDKSIQSPPSKEAFAVFPNLSPGEYQLTIYAQDPGSGESLIPAYLSIHVMHAPWSSPLALSLYVLLTLTLFGAWLYHRQLGRQRLIEANTSLQENQRRLQLALAVSNSGVWEWQADTNQCYEPRIKDVLGYSSDRIDMDEFHALIHPEDRQHAIDHWQAFLDNSQAIFDISYRLKGNDNLWYWFRDLGRAVSRDEDGQALQASGIYTNITETRINEERAKLFGEAYKNTQDWVVILNARQAPIAANDAFLRVFGYRHEGELTAQKADFSFGVDKEKRRYYTSVISHLALNDYWQGEDLITPSDGQSRDVQVRISAVSMSPAKEAAELYYVVILTDISEQKQAENELKQLANYDPLTNLPNRSLLMDRIKQGIHHARRYKNQMALLFVDLDKFKQVNDSMGHEAGDSLLQEIANRMQLVLRGGDTVARLGGDEFVILSSDYDSVEDVTHMADRIIHTVERPVVLNGQEVTVSCSIGIALFPDDAGDSSALLRNADIAMYHAKEMGRGHFQFFAEHMNERAHGQLEAEQELRRAFAQQEFINYYQPIMDTANDCIMGYELLLRWQKQGQLISPADFIPMAEDMGLIVPMTIQAIERGVEFLKTQYGKMESCYLSVNLSPVHFESDMDMSQVLSALDDANLPPSVITFEITEGVLMKDYQQARQTMGELKSAGFRLALDDFGTGYSSLKYLKEFPLDLLKIDKSFVADIGLDKNDEQIIATILMMASNLDMQCIAEGIESEQQKAFLEKLGCFWHQGFYYHKPMSQEQCGKL
ncbi:uncharacterized protein HMF8227_00806 [Saliniradius amylolyticus]|uniref:Uncharacterized protein n=1 Tax=Saliniradius amylolyticus TaxID=2183582 RepID=A0A2S2E1A3_9ALTE|nr:EAL domain-containing protein [Saliniradius amylolyticus]AWL11302.1 uncharacterized protein HMF8227_00806 [Saliniradius amylolyticus]